MTEWIPLDERRPEVGSRVFGYWPRAELFKIQVATVEANDCWSSQGAWAGVWWDLGPPTHWMPCPPDPPRPFRADPDVSC